jgi:hypothetical protein
MANPTPWPDNERETLRELWSTNAAAAIALVLGRTRNAVIGMARRMNLPPKANTGGGYHPKPGTVRNTHPKVSLKKVIHRVEPRPEASGPVPLMEALSHHCRSVLDLKDKDGLPMVCGKPIVEGQTFSFCSEHLKQYTTKGYAR